MKQQQSKPTAKSQLKINEKAKSVICKVCRQPFMITASMIDLQQHQESKHPKLTFADCFDKWTNFPAEHGFEKCGAVIDFSLKKTFNSQHIYSFFLFSV